MTEREKLIEAMARAICREDGIRPTRLEPGTAFGVDGKLPNGDDGFFTWRLYIGKATAALSAIEASGAVVVPVKATDEMAEAGWVRLCDHTHLTAEDIYTVMLAASPFAKEPS
jgi:hypothetical protein